MSSAKTELGSACELLEQSCVDSLAWLEDNEAQVGTYHGALQRTLKRSAVDARRLAKTADRAVSVGVFGPSQVGKSFLSNQLIGGAAAADTGSASGQVLMGSGDSVISMNFGDQINPVGGDETTGLVTRFTRNPVVTPPGFPVALRLFKELDFARILANTFTFDLSCDSVKPLTSEYLTQKIAEYSAKIEGSSFSDNLCVEDIYELEDYFEKSLANRHPLIKDQQLKTLFWSSAERIAPRLPAKDRAAFLSIMWGEIDGFTSLYLELKAALDQLGHPEMAFAQLNAIEDRTPRNTILHVLTMKHGLDPGKADENVQVAQLTTLDGHSANLRMPVVTTLVSELILQLAAPEWPFFETADLLDFPGARSRADKNRDQFFNETAKTYPLGEAVLRGKIAVLFDRYSADFDLNTMIACHKAEKIEVTSFPMLVESWAKRMQGNSAQERSSKADCLFMAVTWCDLLFKPGADHKERVQSMTNQLNMLVEFSTVTEEWKPGSAFENSFLIRDPNASKLSELFEYESYSDTEWLELEHRTDAGKALDNYRSAFNDTEQAKRYFDRPGDTWDAMVEPNGGGVALLAQRLQAACEPAIKWQQMAPRVLEIATTTKAALTPFHESGDLHERLIERLEAVRKPINILREESDLIPRLITEFQLTADTVRNCYAQFWSAQQRGGVGGGMGKANFVDAVFKLWVETIARRRDDEHLVNFYRLSAADFQVIATELERGAVIAGVPQTIEEMIEEIEAYGDTTARKAGRVGRAVALTLNEFVSQLGCTGRNVQEFEKEINPLGTSTDFGESGLPEFSDRINEMRRQRDQLLSNWLDALEQLTDSNARHASGGRVDVEQNKRLGDALDCFGEVVSKVKLHE